MANDKDFKVGTSIKPKRYLEALGTVVAGTDGPSGLFSTTLYTGTGASLAINNGLNLSGDGGLVWTKVRSNAYNNHLFDTARGALKRLRSDSNEAESSTTNSVTSFNNNGFTVNNSSEVNNGGWTYVSWSWKKTSNFFDIVTYTGNGANRTIAHNLGSVPGMIIVKCVSHATSDWLVYHRGADGSAPEDYGFLLNGAYARQDSSGYWNDTAPTSSVFSIGTNGNVNTNGNSYVAYLFAHNNETINCGAYTGNGSATGPVVTTGFQPQWLLVKAASSTGDWWIVDSVRGVVDGGNDPRLLPNTTDAEATSNYVKFTSNGFQPEAGFGIVNGSGITYIYMAIAAVTDTDILDLSTGSVFNYTPTASKTLKLSNPAASGTNSGATLLLTGSVASSFDLANTVDDSVPLAITEGDLRSLTMSNSGTKLYIGSSTNNSVYQYSLSTAYDATTATYDSVSFNHSSQATNFQGLALKPDGTKMFGSTSSTMYQYSLSTAFNVSTASYDSVSFSHGRTTGEMVFKPDGTRFFIVDSSSDDIRQFDLSSAWDLSTASYNNVLFDLSNQDSKPFGVAFNNDGTKMFILGSTNDSIFQYSLSTAWTVSSASYDSVSYDYGSATEASVFFNDNGTKMFIAEEGGDEDIRRFTVGSASTITYNSSIKFSGGTAPTSPEVDETDVITFDTTDGGTTYLASHAIDGAK